MNSGLSHAPCNDFLFLLVFGMICRYKNKQFRMFFYKIICGGISFCKPPYCSILHLEAREYYGLCGNNAYSETIMCVNFFWTAPSCILGELLLVVKDRALNATVFFEWQQVHIQKDAQFRGASAGVSLEEIQQLFFEKYAFCFACLGYRDKAISLILLVLPYTILPEGLNCLFVSPYMKMLRHYLRGGFSFPRPFLRGGEKASWIWQENYRFPILLVRCVFEC